MTAADDNVGDYYATLGVAPGDGPRAIRAAYRDLMRRYHPDVNASVDADRRAKDINEAYACLGDDHRRASYDRSRAAIAPEPFQAGIRPQRRTRTATFDESHDLTPPTAKMFEPTWWKMGLLGAATIVTIITFALTSSTPPPMPVFAAGPAPTP